MNKYSERSAVFFIPEKNFHDQEFLITKSLLEKNGIKVFVASENKNLSQGSFGYRVKPEMYLFNLHPQNFKALVLIGGEGARSYWNHSQLIKIIKDFNKNGKIIAAICSAVGILASADLLKNKKATCFVKEYEFVKSSGSIVTNNLIELDDKILTAANPEATELFGKKLSELILEVK